MKRVAITGGIACGKSLVARYLRGVGVETIDADDIVHDIIPDPEERRRIAAEVFADAEKRRRLEAEIHPKVKERIDAFLEGAGNKLRIAVVPLLFEAHWDGDYDIICTVVSNPEVQVARMMATRGYTPEEARSRMAAQLPAMEKAARSDYVIRNGGTEEDLKAEVERFAAWLRKRAFEAG